MSPASLADCSGRKDYGERARTKDGVRLTHWSKISRLYMYETWSCVIENVRDEITHELRIVMETPDVAKREELHYIVKRRSRVAVNIQNTHAY